MSVITQISQFEFDVLFKTIKNNKLYEKFNKVIILVIKLNYYNKLFYNYYKSIKNLDYIGLN